MLLGEEANYKPEALVPIWVKTTGIEALDRMAARPVRIEVEKLRSSMIGQMVDLTLSEARVMPDEPVLIWKDVQVWVRFRYSNIVFTLAGKSKEWNPDGSISFEFDEVSRKRMLILAQEGLFRGEAEEKVEEREAESDPTKPRDPRRVRHLGGPGGVERRASPRYDLYVEGVLSNLDTARAINCLVLEVSKSGCRIYTETPNDLQLNGFVEVQFVALGYPLRLSATVQVKTGEQLLGLKFTEVSYRIKTRLANLIFELAEREAPLD
jgi:hypothetical protein